MRLYLSLVALAISAVLLPRGCAGGLQPDPGAGQAGEKDVFIFEGNSMLPGIRDGDKLTVERFDCRGGPHALKRGDIIAFWYPDDPSKVYIKRIIGLPDEAVLVRRGLVIIDGSRELAEPYVAPAHNSALDDRPPVYVKPHYYYVMGDNRDNSSDSRVWGLVPEKYIFARVIDR